MVSRAVIDEFVGQKSLAIVGVSRSGKKFGNSIRKELSKKGYQLHAVHPEATSIDGQPCVRSLAELAGQVSGVIVVTKPAQTTQVVREAAAAGITRVWLQQGAESDEAIRFCEEKGLSVVHHECILMFSEPAAFPHRLHRGILKLVGRLPK